MPLRPPRGFSSWSRYNAWRVRHGVERGLTPSQARGHPRGGERPASEVQRHVRVIGRDGATEVSIRGVAELSRAGRFDRDVGELLAGRLDPRTYNRRWVGKTVGGVQLPDASRVLGLGRTGEARLGDFYPTRVST